jgi:phosphorylcholine metabolism protein LicD
MYIIFVVFKRKSIFLTSKEIETFYDGMKKVDTVLQEHNIPYFVICGTLLGVARHQEIIPWDDDIDIAIFDKDVDRFMSIDFSKYGYETYAINRDNENCCGKIFLDKDKKLWIDVFPFEKVDDKYRYKEDRARKIWPKEYLYEEELFPLKKYKFGKIEVYCPNNIIPYCERAWGKNGWKKCPVKVSKFISDPITSIRMLFTKTKPIS